MNAIIKNFPAIPQGCVSFVNICNYENAAGEKQCTLINIGVSYEKAKQKDIHYLKNLNIETLESNTEKSLLEQARAELLNSLISPSENRSNAQQTAYTHIINGIKIHNETGSIYIFGMKVRKTITEKGEYSEDTRKPLTKAKDEIRRGLRTTKYRMYKIPKFEAITIKGDTIEINELKNI